MTISRDHLLEIDIKKEIPYDFAVIQENNSCTLIRMSANLFNEEGKEIQRLGPTQKKFMGPISEIRYKYTEKRLYPAPKARGKIKYLCKAPDEALYYALTEEGYICVYNLQGNDGLLEEMIHYTEIKDIEDKSIPTKPLRLSLFEQFPPNYDYKLKVPTILPKVRKVKTFLTLGCEMGDIVYLDVGRLNRLFCRFHSQRSHVAELHEMKRMEVHYLVVYSESRALSIYLIAKEEVKLCSIVQSTHLTITCMKTQGNPYLPNNFTTYWFLFIGKRLFIGNKKGFLLLFKISKNASDVTGLADSDSESHHANEIVGIDFLERKKIILTQGLDYRIKLWTSKKEILYSISFEDHRLLAARFFSQEGDILLIHDHYVSYLEWDNFPSLDEERNNAESKTRTKKNTRIKAHIEKEQVNLTDFFHSQHLENLTTYVTTTQASDDLSINLQGIEDRKSLKSKKSLITHNRSSRAFEETTQNKTILKPLYGLQTNDPSIKLLRPKIKKNEDKEPTLSDARFEYIMNLQSKRNQKPLWKEQRELREQIQHSRQDKSFDYARAQDKKPKAPLEPQNRSFSIGKPFKESDYSPEGPLPKIFNTSTRKNNYSKPKKELVLDNLRLMQARKYFPVMVSKALQIRYGMEDPEPPN